MHVNQVNLSSPTMAATLVHAQSLVFGLRQLAQRLDVFLDRTNAYPMKSFQQVTVVIPALVRHRAFAVKRLAPRPFAVMRAEVRMIV